MSMAITERDKGINKIYHGDCMELLPCIPDASVDMVLCDLPYGTTACKWDTVLPLDTLWEHYKRVIKPHNAIVLFGSQPFTTMLIASNMDMFKYIWVWSKSNATDAMNAKNKPLKMHEDICVFSFGATANGSKNKMVYYPQDLTPTKRKRIGVDYGLNPSFKVPRPSHRAYVQECKNYPTSILYFGSSLKERLHPTQKPIALCEYLIKTYTNPGDVVLDNCIGSGTTAIACINTGRQYIGIEKEEKYFTIALERIKQAQEQYRQRELWGVSA